MADVVVVGYGVQRKGERRGRHLAGQGATPSWTRRVEYHQALAGKLSGVTTLQTSGQPGDNDSEILIRGVSSFSNSNPLVLVDGVERDFSTIDPNEVANISVLKDCSATAVFGAKGANGVIIVTTKSGQEGKPEDGLFVLDGFRHADQHPEAHRLLPDDVADERGQDERPALRFPHVGGGPQRVPPSLVAAHALRYPDVNWLDEMTDSFASTINANFNIQGGTRFVKYFCVGGLRARRLHLQGCERR